MILSVKFVAMTKVIVQSKMLFFFTKFKPKTFEVNSKPYKDVLYIIMQKGMNLSAEYSPTYIHCFNAYTKLGRHRINVKMTSCCGWESNKKPTI